MTIFKSKQVTILATTLLFVFLACPILTLVHALSDSNGQAARSCYQPTSCSTEQSQEKRGFCFLDKVESKSTPSSVGFPFVIRSNHQQLQQVLLLSTHRVFRTTNNSIRPPLYLLHYFSHAPPIT